MSDQESTPGVTTIEYTQYMRPNGRQVSRIAILPETPELLRNFAALSEAGCRIAAEVLMNDLVSLTIEYPELGDFSGKVTQNGPEVPAAMVELILGFDTNKYEQWKAVEERIQDSAPE